jgi:hypothetical protein
MFRSSTRMPLGTKRKSSVDGNNVLQNIIFIQYVIVGLTQYEFENQSIF